MVNELISCIAVCAYMMIGIIDLRDGMDLRNKSEKETETETERDRDREIDMEREIERERDSEIDR